MASTPSQWQSIPIAQDWADLEIAQEFMTTHNLFGTLFFSLIEELLTRLINSVQGAFSTLHDDETSL
jgi:hypothetical protein